jgi:hypothetical protein
MRKWSVAQGGWGEKQNSMQQLYCTLGLKEITA